MAALTEGIIDKVLAILLRTFPSYRDRPSRKAVRDCLRVTLNHYPNAVDILTAAFTEEARKTNIAPSNAFVLVEWGSLIIAECGKGERLWQSHGKRIIVLHAQILETCIASRGKPGLKHSALVATQRAFSDLFHGEDGEQRVGQVVNQLTDTTSQLGVRAAVLLGLVAGVCARRSQLKSLLEEQKNHYKSFFLREVIGSRITVPHHLANALAVFFSEFITFEDMQKDVAPAIEKALLRAPEVVLNDLVSPLIISLPENIDLTPLLADRLAKPLLSNMKSSNAQIRDGAASTFINLIKKSHSEADLSRVTGEILVPLSNSKLAVAEHRVLYSRILANLRVSSNRSEEVCKILVTVAIKEPNETALNAELQALSQHLVSIIRSNSGSYQDCFKTCSENFCKGLSDKKPANRKAWVLAIGDVIWQTQEYSNLPEVRLFVGATIAKLLEVYQEVISNVLSATQSGMVAVGFVLTALCTYFVDVIEDSKLTTAIHKASVYDRACSTDPKTSILLSHRVYSKLTTREDLRWAIRALGACLSHISSAADDCSLGDAWGQALIYMITASVVPYDMRKEACMALKEYYINSPLQISRYIVKSLWSWENQLIKGQQDGPAAASKLNKDRLHLVVKAICPRPNQTKLNSDLSQELIRDQLMKMIVLCRSPLIPNVSWIEICLATGQDPGDLVRTASERCLAEVLSPLGGEFEGTQSMIIDSARYSAAAELAFVAPDAMIPLLMQEITEDLPGSLVRSYSPTDVAIARTPEETTFVDVLSAKRDFTIDKKAKDYDTLKWEADVRSQLASKKEQDRKLSADERAKVDAQLKKEAVIRRNVLALEQRLRRGIGIIDALTNGPPTDPSTWFGPCSKALLDIIAANAGMMIGDCAEVAYLDLAKLVSPRLGYLRRFIGVASLRALGNSTLPDSVLEEPLGGTYGESLITIRWAECRRACYETVIPIAVPQ